eukprot:NODE_1730_length_1072_cov_376.179941.p1 GENE.NODE_1730_length_1072_cov_376.179941~~NODE_1730_length_1072_cov_376.179941.p1  ORF type:complete len:280 (+),score=36.83 NODE_1730_length_1072_cov_376.179941:88-927(+)
MLLPIQHIHSVGILHCDIKPENYLVCGTGVEETVKLCDFGLAKVLPESGMLQSTRPEGTAPYMSPEVVCMAPYGVKTDAWSFGATAYLMLFGEFPYMPSDLGSAAAMQEAIRAGAPAPTFTSATPGVTLSAQAADFCRMLLARGQQERAGTNDALQHVFLRPKPALVDAAVGAEGPSLMAALLSARKHSWTYSGVDSTHERNLAELHQALLRKGVPFHALSEGMGIQPGVGSPTRRLNGFDCSLAKTFSLGDNAESPSVSGNRACRRGSAPATMGHVLL